MEKLDLNDAGNIASQEFLAGSTEHPYRRAIQIDDATPLIDREHGIQAGPQD